MSELFAEILKQWELVQQDRATCQQYLERTGPGESPYTRGQQEAWNMREHCLSRTLLASMPEIAPLLATSDATGKVLLTKESVLHGCHWRHSNGMIFCGTLRIAREDFDTNPSPEFRARVFDDICERMNATLTKEQTPETDDTGKVLLTNDQWEEAQRDKARLDWMSQMQVDCEGRILTRVFMPSDKTLRHAIDAARADTKGTSA